MLGFVNGLIAAPCTGPVLAVLLTWVATTGNVAFGAIALFIYAIGIGVLFWFVGTFAVTLPRSGRWVEWTKSAFGIAMLALAFYYVRGVLPTRVRQCVTRSGCAGIGAAGGRRHRWRHPSVIQGRCMGGSDSEAVGVAACVAGVLGIVGWAEALPPGAHIGWVESFEAGKTRALTEERPMLVDFAPIGVAHARSSNATS